MSSFNITILYIGKDKISEMDTSYIGCSQKRSLFGNLPCTFLSLLSGLIAK